MKTEQKSKLRIIPLGGMEQIGMNITAFEYEDSIIVVDCGLSFPNDDMLGIDLVFAVGSGDLAGKIADGVALSGEGIFYHSRTRGSYRRPSLCASGSECACVRHEADNRNY